MPLTSNLRKHYLLAALTVLYFAIFLPNVLANNISTEFMEVDPSSIISAIKTISTSHLYNMLEPYHSKFYGWTYIAINFFSVAPLYAAGAPEQVTNTAIRIVHFILGYGEVFVFYLVLKEIFNKSTAFLGTAILLTHPAAGHYFITIHPESTGVLFYLVGVYHLIRYAKGRTEYRTAFLFTVGSFTLATLAKQPFGFVAAATLPIYIYLFALRTKQPWHELFSLKEFYITLAWSFLLVITIAFLIHPYAFFDFPTFLKFQLALVADGKAYRSETTLSEWIETLRSDPILVIHMLLLAFLLPIFSKARLLAYSIVASSAIAAIYMNGQTRFISHLYLYPLYPVLIINICGVLSLACSSARNHISSDLLNALKVGLVTTFLLVLVPGAMQTVVLAHRQWLLEGRSTKNFVWDYVLTLPKKSKIAYVPVAAIPDAWRKTGCHVWQGCQTYDALGSYRPDYIIVSWNYPFFKADDYRRYIEDVGGTLVHTIAPTSGLSSLGGCYKKMPDNRIVSSVSFAFLSPHRWIKAVRNCIYDYASMIKVRRTLHLPVEGWPLQVYWIARTSS